MAIDSASVTIDLEDENPFHPDAIDPCSTRAATTAAGGSSSAQGDYHVDTLQTAALSWKR